VFLNGADASDAKSLVKTLSEQAKKHDGFRAFVYFLDGTPEQLKKLNRELGVDNIALALIPPGSRKDTLKMYEVNPEAKSTVLVYLNRNIKKNMVNFNPKRDTEALKNAISKICE